MTGSSSTPFNGESQATFDGTTAIIAGMRISTTGFAAKSVDNTAKYKLWGTDSAYAIGMTNSQTYGYLNGYATNFHMNNSSSRGWKFSANTATSNTGAMSLTVDGRMYVDKIINTPTYTFPAGGTITSNGSTMRFQF